MLLKQYGEEQAFQCGFNLPGRAPENGTVSLRDFLRLEGFRLSLTYSHLLEQRSNDSVGPRHPHAHRCPEIRHFTWLMLALCRASTVHMKYAISWMWAAAVG